MANEITEVRLLSVPLENDYKHTFYFASLEEQITYFTRNLIPTHTISECSYQRKDGYISFPDHFDNLQDSNYLMYRNKNKWYFAFITRMEYKSDSLTWIYFETDVMQTYMFDITIKPSFVEREHTDDDTFGANTIPENLECGEFVCEYNSNISELQNLNIVMGVTKHYDETGDNKGVLVGGGTYQGIFSGVTYVSFPRDKASNLREHIQKYDEGDAEAIQNIFLAPSFLSRSFENLANPNYSILTQGRINSTLEANKLEHSINNVRNTELYDPKNAKAMCFPYRYLLVSNNNGGAAVYHYEDFKDKSSFVFNIYGSLTPGCSIRLIPTNYKGVYENNEEGLNLGKYPICNWTSDAFTNWLTQNGVNIAINTATGVAQIIGGIAATVGTAGAGSVMGGGMVASGVGQIAGQMGQIYQMSFTPPQAQGNINCGDVITSTSNNTFTFYGMTIKDEYMKIIDKFFDMFGYKVNSVKVPNKAHRQAYWYTKTIDVSIDGNLPSEDMNKVKNCYNTGITFWRKGASVGDYSLSNNILST